MGFSIDTRGMAPLRNYTMCDAFYTGLSKPRGSLWEEDERPLRDNRSHHLRIRPGKCGDVQTYELWLYETPLVTHYADGRVRVKYSDTQSSSRFIRNYTNNLYGFNRGLFCIRHPAFTWHWYSVDKKAGEIVLSADNSILSGTVPRKRAVLKPEYKKLVSNALKEYSFWKRGSNRLGILPSPRYLASDEYNAILADLASRISANDKIEPDTFVEIYEAESSSSDFRTELYSKLGAWGEIEINTVECPKKHHHSIPHSWMYS